MPLCFYAIGVYLNPDVPVAGLPTLATGIRSITYVSVGLVVGFYASRNRALTARLSELMDELHVLADRDVLTGLPNTRAFEVGPRVWSRGSRLFCSSVI